MSEPIWTMVRIKVPRSWGDPDHTPWIIEDARDALCNGDGPHISDEGPDWIIWSAYGEGNYGLLDDQLESVFEWCHQHRVPYWGNDEPNYEFHGSVVMFDGDKVHNRSASSDGEIVFHESQWIGLSARTDSEIVAALREHFETIPRLADVPIDHLSARCPDSSDNEGD